MTPENVGMARLFLRFDRSLQQLAKYVAMQGGRLRNSRNEWSVFPTARVTILDGWFLSIDQSLPSSQQSRQEDLHGRMCSPGCEKLPEDIQLSIAMRPKTLPLWFRQKLPVLASFQADLLIGGAP